MSSSRRVRPSHVVDAVCKEKKAAGALIRCWCVLFLAKTYFTRPRHPRRTVGKATAPSK